MKNILVFAGTHREFADYMRDKDPKSLDVAYKRVICLRDVYGRHDCDLVVIGTFCDMKLYDEVRDYLKSHGTLA